ncbi:MAG: response regulator receiver sensor signal transduction histidine kinase [Rariglobus sp.]|jgi:signal transduction histidine kinase|nr:response regulator receiver sensor signal transduction histidine kinase [Rariglobus sp.]
MTTTATSNAPPPEVSRTAPAATPAPAPGAAPKELRILLLEDNASHAEIVEHVLKEGGLRFSLTRVETRDAFQDQLERATPDLILSDYALPSFDGYTALTIAKEKNPGLPFIFVTGTMGEEVAIETLKNGATDYVLKTRLARLVPSVRRALQEAEERRERRRAEEQLRRSHQQLRALTTYLQYVREEERTRISREVHDELGQALTGLKMDLAWLSGHLPQNARGLQPKIKTMSSGIDATINTVRRISTELRPGILDSLGLVAAIEWQASEFQTRTGITCNVTITVSETLWDQDFTTAFFRIFQETLTNIIRHAKATRVEVKLDAENGSLVLTVADNGRGITEEEMTNTRSIGLIGMRERAALVGGDIGFQSAPGKGTTVTVRIPLPRSPSPAGPA